MPIITKYTNNPSKIRFLIIFMFNLKELSKIFISAFFMDNKGKNRKATIFNADFTIYIGSMTVSTNDIKIQLAITRIIMPYFFFFSDINITFLCFAYTCTKNFFSSVSFQNKGNFMKSTPCCTYIINKQDSFSPYCFRIYNIKCIFKI